MVGHKLLLVEPYRLDPKTRDALVTTGRSLVAVDTVGAGVGEMVLITQGSSARLTPGNQNPARRHGDHRHHRFGPRGTDVCVSVRNELRPWSTIDETTDSQRASRTSPDSHVVEQVLTAGQRHVPANGGYQGRFGLFTDVNEAVAAAREAFERLSGMTIEDRRRIIGHIRRIAIEQCVELGTMEMEETKIGRLPAQDREAQDAGRALAGRRVPPQRGLQRRPRPGGHRTRPLRRHRRDYAGDALAAHASPATR